MSRKQLAAIVAAVVMLLSALATGVAGLTSSSGQNERLRAVEVRQETIDGRLERNEKTIDRRLERIEKKLDELLLRGGK